MKTVRIYRNRCVKGYRMWEQGEAWSLMPWPGNSVYYEGGVERELLVRLPEGYGLVVRAHGDYEKLIFDSKGRLCELGENRNGEPMLLTPDGPLPLETVTISDELRQAFIADDSVDLTREERENAPDYLVLEWADAVEYHDA
ncbi:MAG: hypothetical protein JRJ78_14705 [Deltaproteobacteria bacterium]|nr:hypothetical protein [Deltaproteobacteria bacterium]